MEKNPRFVRLYREFASPLMRFLLRRMGGDEAAAEDVFAQTMAAAWRGYSTFRRKSNFFTWLCRIGLNKAADYWKEQINRRSFVVVPVLQAVSRLGSSELSVEEAIVLEELCCAVRKCVGLLPEEKRRLIYLKYWKQMTIKRIARVMFLGERSVEGKLYRAKAQFREIFKKEYPEFVVADKRVWRMG